MIFAEITRWTRMRCSVYALLLAMKVPECLAEDASRPSDREVEEVIQQNSIVGFEWVDMPLGSILLIRDNNRFCAIRFLSYGRSGDSRPASPFDTGESSRFASYEVSEFGPENYSSGAKGVIVHELRDLGMRGFGRLAFVVGNTDITCREKKYSWMFPTGLILKKEDAKTSLAPTDWTSFDKIQLKSPALLWYQRDPELKRRMQVIPRGELAH